MRRVAVVAFAQTKHVRHRTDLLPAQMVYAVCKEVVAKAGIPHEEIDFMAAGSADYLEGRPFSFGQALRYEGAWPPVNETHLEMDGAWAAYYAWLRLLTGKYDTALITAWNKSSEASLHHVLNIALDPFYESAIGVDPISIAAMQARAYMERSGVTSQQLAKVAVKNRGNAKKNPNAQIKGDYTVEQVLASPMLADPLHLMDCPPITDGAAAILLAAEGKAEQLCSRPAWITGAHHATDYGIMGARDLAELPSARAAAAKAYEMAGIREPRRELHVAEICEPFTHHELMLYESFGFCGAGEAGKLLDSGATAAAGELPVNPSGGCLAADPIMCRGLVRLGEAALQVMGEAGGHQVAHAQRALAHCAYGHGLQSNMVWIVEA
jgi:acetyl-CoA acetyltransferase